MVALQFLTLLLKPIVFLGHSNVYAMCFLAYLAIMPRCSWAVRALGVSSCAAHIYKIMHSFVRVQPSLFNSAARQAALLRPIHRSRNVMEMGQRRR